MSQSVIELTLKFKLQIESDMTFFEMINLSFEVENIISKEPNCIRQLKNAVYNIMFYEWKKNRNIQEVHKNLQISGSLIFSLLC